MPRYAKRRSHSVSGSGIRMRSLIERALEFGPSLLKALNVAPRVDPEITGSTTSLLTRVEAAERAERRGALGSAAGYRKYRPVQTVGTVVSATAGMQDGASGQGARPGSSAVVKKPSSAGAVPSVHSPLAGGGGASSKTGTASPTGPTSSASGGGAGTPSHSRSSTLGAVVSAASGRSALLHHHYSHRDSERGGPTAGPSVIALGRRYPIAAYRATLAGKACGGMLTRRFSQVEPIVRASVPLKALAYTVPPDTYRKLDNFRCWNPCTRV
jgi:hypothetical protein